MTPHLLGRIPPTLPHGININVLSVVLMENTIVLDVGIDHLIVTPHLHGRISAGGSTALAWLLKGYPILPPIRWRRHGISRSVRISIKAGINHVPIVFYLHYYIYVIVSLLLV